MTTQPLYRIISRPGIVRGKPHIADHRITVQHVVIMHLRQGMPEAEVAAQYGLTPGGVKAALDYYAEHRAEIDEGILADERFLSELRGRTRSKVE